MPTATDFELSWGAHGAELLGEVAQYESIFRLCYLRGPVGIIVALAERIG